MSLYVDLNLSAVFSAELQKYFLWGELRPVGVSCSLSDDKLLIRRLLTL